MKSKKLVSVLLIAMLMLSLFPANALADELGCCGVEDHRHDALEPISTENWWVREETVYLDSEDDIWTYDMDPRVRYIFIVDIPSPKRAVCPECGYSTVNLYSETEESGNMWNRACPINDFGSDLMWQYITEYREYCTRSSCDYELDPWYKTTYKALCVEKSQFYNVALAYTQNNGYNIHCSLKYWLYGSFE